MSQINDIRWTRRRLLTAIGLSPLWLKLPSARAAVPDVKRIIALEWMPVELLMALGVTPMAVADISNYQTWVNQPRLPAGVIDVGLRTEPNLELMAQLKPSLILYSAGYGPSPAKITRVAPGLGFNFNDGSGKPLDVARQSLITLGDTLGMQRAASRHLAAFDALITRMKPRFAARGDRPVLLISFLDNRHVLVAGKHSLFQQVMDRLGVKNGWQEETSFWGTAVVGIERLPGIKDADVLCFEHKNDAIARQVAATPLWKAMPFIRQNRFQQVPAVWLYGSTMSAMRFVHVLDDGLRRIP